MNPATGRDGVYSGAGIYIPEENLGIRLENNVLITTNGQMDLMKNIPIEAEEIGGADGYIT